MQAFASSRPASGGGHHFSHLWEMEHYGLDWDPPLSHGFKVGLGTVSVAALYEVVLAKDIPAMIDIDAAVAAHPTWEQTADQVRAALSPDLHEAALARGVKLTGATVHLVNEECDGGPILLQKAVAVEPGDTPETLQKRVMVEAEWQLLPKALAMVCSDEV